MKKLPLLLLIICLSVVTRSQPFRDYFLGTYTGKVDIYDVGGHFIGSDRLFVNPSTSDTNNIIIPDSIGWIGYEYILHLDSSFTDIWQPNLRYGYFYSGGDSIFIHDVHNNPWFREWHCGRLGAGMHEVRSFYYSVFPNPARYNIKKHFRCAVRTKAFIKQNIISSPKRYITG